MGMPIAQAQFLPRTITLGINTVSRKAIEQQIDFLIGLLDQIDGDPDLEEDDHHFDPLDFGELDRISVVKPTYRIDQSTGPNNLSEAWAPDYELPAGFPLPEAFIESDEYAQIKV